MSRFNTGNPLGSDDPRDLDDNAKNMDLAVNSDELRWSDRFGRDRKSFEGMEREFADDQSRRESEFDSDQSRRENEFDAAQAYRDNAFESAQTYRESRFNEFIASSGYQFLADYGPGIEITEYNQLVRDENGEFWRLSGQIELPYTTTGAGIPEGDALVPAGDAVLRQDLSNPDKGALIVRRSTIYVRTLSELHSLPTGYLEDGQVALVSGGHFEWSASTMKWVLMGDLPVEAMGAKGDDETDDTSVINAALTQFGSAYLSPGKTYLVSGEISVPEGASLSSSAERATIRTTDTTGVVISLNHDSTVENLRIKLKTGHSSHETGGIRVNPGPNSVKCYARNIDILGSGIPLSNGSAIIFSGDAGYITFCHFENIYIERVRAGLYANLTNGAYANGNIFNGIVCRSSYRLVHLEAGSNANQFTNISWNTSSLGAAPIYCKTGSNIFDGFFYDIHDGLEPNVLAIFEGTSIGNHIRSSLSSPIIIDNTPLRRNWYNIDVFAVNDHLLRQTEIPNIWMSGSELDALGNYTARWKPYRGVQDNYLAFADKLHNVTVNGAAPSATARNVFNPFSYNSAGKPTYSGGAPVVFEIEFLDNNPRRQFDFLQVAFSSTLIAKYIKFESYNLASGEWVVISETFDNKARFVTEYGQVNQGLGGVVNSGKVRVTVADPDNGNSIRVESITGRVLTTTGTAFFPMGGGTLYGDVAFSSAGTGPVMVAPDGGKWRISVDNSGAISTTSI